MFIQNIHKASAFRRPLVLANPQGAFRLVNDAADGCVGLTLDYYNSYLVANIYQSLPIPLDRSILDTVSSAGILCHDIIFKDRRCKRAGSYLKPRQDSDELSVEILEEGQRIEVHLKDGLSTGIFCDQRNNRAFLAGLAKTRNAKRMLNGFCYTSVFSLIACSKQPGLRTVNVDLSARALQRSVKNFSLNGFNQDQEFVRVDFARFLKGAMKHQSKYDIIVIDPPTAARDKSGKTIFLVRRDLGALVADAVEILNPGGLLFVSINTETISDTELENMILASSKVALRSVSLPKPPADFVESKSHPLLMKARLYEKPSS